jgi:hypothetical protein
MGRFLLGIFLLVALAAAQTTNVGGKTREAQPAGAAAVPKNTYPPSEFELLLTRYRFEDDGTGRKEVIAKIRILNQMGTLQQSEQSFDYHPVSEALRIPYVRVRKKDGTVVEVETEVVQQPPDVVTKEYDYDKRNVRILGLAVGDLVEYDVVRVINRPLGQGEFCLQHNFEPSVVDDEQLEIDIPKSRDVRVKNVTSVKSWLTNDGTRKVYHWKNWTPGPHQVTAIPYVAGRTPDVQVSSFTSWGQVGRWDSELTMSHSVPTPEVKAIADELTNGLSSEIERAEALYDFAAKKIRYVSLVSLGIGGYEPKSAAETIRDGYGDCKDKTALLIALLKAENLNASSVLISADRKLDRDFPSPWPFDHVITMLRLDKEEVWMDPSSAVLPFRMLSYPLRDQDGLVIPSGGAPHFERTPAEAPVPSSWLEEIDGNVSENGTLDATVRITARGDAEIRLRQAFLSPVESVWPWTIQGVVKGIDRADKVSEIKITDPTATSGPFTLSFRISKPIFIQVWEKEFKMRLPFSDLHLASVDGGEVAEWHRTTTEAMWLGPPSKRTYRIRLDLAPRFAVENPPPVALERGYAGYHASYEVNANLLIAERELVTRKAELSSALVEDYNGFQRRVLADSALNVAVQAAEWNGATKK